MAVATANFQSTPDMNTLLEGASRLHPTDLKQFIQKLQRMAAQPNSPDLPEHEAFLIDRIKNGLPNKVFKRARQLTRKMQEETITGEEHQELLDLSQQILQFDVERLENLIELAKLRQVSLDEIMRQLDIKPR